jgi:hypothetical protein
MDGVPEVRMFTRTFHYGTHHIHETRWVESGHATLRHTIDGWDVLNNTYLPYIFKYLDVVDSKRGKTAICRD